jgi:chorismate dehydratase
MIRLGHIDYSNCVPVHSRLLERVKPEGIQLVMGVPSELNDALLNGRVDVAPCSSIEYARHADAYTLLPDLVIGSDGRVGSILLESAVPLEELDRRAVWLPTASASSVVLLRILLETKLGMSPDYSWFHQADAGDPVGIHASAVLRIGDVALRRVVPGDRHVYDLGELWKEWTGLPFAYAVWQVRAGAPADEMKRLHGILVESRSFFEANSADLAGRHASRFGLDADRLNDYWTSLRYTLDDRMQQGLLRFYEYAAALGEAPPVTELHWFDLG